MPGLLNRVAELLWYVQLQAFFAKGQTEHYADVIILSILSPREFAPRQPLAFPAPLATKIFPSAWKTDSMRQIMRRYLEKR
ncbi:hypothetical protein AFK66_022390 [Cronobacter malonaticus LMG 23826]|nr:hypothetical protein AFK66_022390 [Cronobacter malonaticus LMG 23826]